MAWLTAVGRVLQRMRGEINGWHSKAAVKYEKLQYAEVVKSSSTESSEWCWNKSKSLGGGIFQVVDHCWKVDHLCLHRWWASKFHPELEHYVSIRSSWYLGDVYKDIWSKLTMVLACAGFFWKQSEPHHFILQKANVIHQFSISIWDYVFPWIPLTLKKEKDREPSQMCFLMVRIWIHGAGNVERQRCRTVL